MNPAGGTPRGVDHGHIADGRTIIAASGGRSFPMLQPESERLPWVAPLSSPTRATGYAVNPLKQPAGAGPPLREGPAVQGPTGGIRAPVQTPKIARSYAVRIDR